MSVALGISVDQIAKDRQPYDLQSAAANTDFDKAQSISDSDPSLFWLALSVVGLALDLGDALRAFRALRGPVRSVMQASETGLKQAETDLRVAARANKAEGIAEGLIEKARKATNADNPKPAFEIAGEAKGFENEAIDKAARQSASVTKELPSSALTEAEIEAELEFLQRSRKLDGPLGERTAKVGEHEWVEIPVPPGMWCRFSKKPRCAIVEGGEDSKVVRAVNKTQVDAPELGVVADEVASAPKNYRQEFLEKLRGAAALEEGSTAYQELAKELGVTPKFLKVAISLAAESAGNVRVHHIVAQTLANHPFIALGIEERLFTKHQWNNLMPLPYTEEVRNEVIKGFGTALPLHRSGHGPLIIQTEAIADRHWLQLRSAAGAQEVSEFVRTTEGRNMLYDLLNDTRNEARDIVLRWPTDRL